MIGTGRSSIDLKKGMDIAFDIVGEFLKTNCVPVSGKQDIINVGTISANGDKEIGEIIAEAIEKVGIDGLITVEPAKSVKTTLRLAEGIQLDSGFVSPFFVTNGEKQTCELEDPYVLITSNKISSLAEIVPLLEKIDRDGKPLLIIADEIEGEALHTLVVNKTKGVLKVCAIKAPSYGEHRADILSDLGVVVNGTVLGATSELNLKTIKLENLGKCKRVVVNRNSCTFLVENNSAKDRITARADVIRTSLLNDHTLDDLRKVRYRERLAKLSGGIAVIQVGGSTEVEIREKKDRVEDAVNATQAAAQEGIVPGGGTALYYASQHLKNLIKDGHFSNQKEDVIAGVKVIANTCEAPFKTIVSNTGVSPDVVGNELTNTWSVGKNFTFGYNAAEQRYGDLVKIGIIDPVKVTRYALEHAVSIIGLTLTCNAVIVNDDVEK
jgi:chaperonin GroEL